MSHAQAHSPSRVMPKDSRLVLVPRLFSLLADEQLRIKKFSSVRCVRGPRTVVVGALSRVQRQHGVLLDEFQYVFVTESLSGATRSVRGPTLFFPTEFEHHTQPMQCVVLQSDEYLKVLDKKSGDITVYVGPKSVFLEPNETLVTHGKERGIKVDKNHAVLVRNLKSGAKELITTPQVFFPEPHLEVIEIRDRIRLENHQVAVVKDKDGAYQYKHGKDAKERAFFLGPHESLVEVWWSSGLSKDSRNLKLSVFDTRPKFMWFDFEARTHDNVELKLGLTFFWQIVDVATMIAMTDDASGDVCSHARSLIIQAVSQITLEHFLSNFNEIVHNAVFREGETFYAERGLKINQVEVRSVACADPKVQAVLQEIIRETTNKLNQLVKQEAAAEISLKELQSKLAVESQRGKLLEVQKAHSEVEAVMAGDAEAIKIKSFLDGLGDMGFESKLEILRLLKRNEALASVSAGSASVFFTPEQCNLSIENRSK